MELQLFDYAKFSSTVRLELHAEGRIFSLASIGPDDIVLRNGTELSPGDANVFMDVDGQSFLWPVVLTHGAVPFERVEEIRTRGDIQRLGTAKIE